MSTLAPTSDLLLLLYLGAWCQFPKLEIQESSFTPASLSPYHSSSQFVLSNVSCILSTLSIPTAPPPAWAIITSCLNTSQYGSDLHLQHLLPLLLYILPSSATECSWLIKQSMPLTTLCFCKYYSLFLNYRSSTSLPGTLLLMLQEPAKKSPLLSSPP